MINIFQKVCILATVVSLQSQCPACLDISAHKEMAKNKIKADILRKLGLSSAPNITRQHFSNVPFVQKQIEEFNRLYSEEGRFKMTTFPLWQQQLLSSRRRR